MSRVANRSKLKGTPETSSPKRVDRSSGANTHHYADEFVWDGLPFQAVLLWGHCLEACRILKQQSSRLAFSCAPRPASQHTAPQPRASQRGFRLFRKPIPAGWAPAWVTALSMCCTSSLQGHWAQWVPTLSIGLIDPALMAKVVRSCRAASRMFGMASLAAAAAAGIKVEWAFAIASFEDASTQSCMYTAVRLELRQCTGIALECCGCSTYFCIELKAVGRTWSTCSAAAFSLGFF